MSIPTTCGQCRKFFRKFEDDGQFMGSAVYFCGHPKADFQGRPLFVMRFEEPPDVCPLRKAVFVSMWESFKKAMGLTTIEQKAKEQKAKEATRQSVEKVAKPIVSPFVPSHQIQRVGSAEEEGKPSHPLPSEPSVAEPTGPSLTASEK